MLTNCFVEDHRCRRFMFNIIMFTKCSNSWFQILHHDISLKFWLLFHFEISYKVSKSNRSFILLERDSTHTKRECSSTTTFVYRLRPRLVVFVGPIRSICGNWRLRSGDEILWFFSLGMHRKNDPFQI